MCFLAGRAFGFNRPATIASRFEIPAMPAYKAH
jgi:hypothetical protein